MRFTEGDIAFLVENNRVVRRVVVRTADMDFYVVSFYEDLCIYGGLRVKHSRLFASREEAEASIARCRSRLHQDPQSVHKSPDQPRTHWDYMM